MQGTFYEREVWDLRNQVVILDFGAQYTQLIARRIREQKVYCQVISGDASVSEIRSAVDPAGADIPGAVILSGGPDSVYEDGAVLPDRAVFELGCPVLGISYGMQAMAKVLGGRVVAARGAGRTREYGPAVLRVASRDGIFEGFPAETRVWMGHGDIVDQVPEGFSVTGSTGDTPVAAMADLSRRLYGVEFHPEVTDTSLGKELIANFLFGVAGLAPDWTMERFVENTVKDIRERVGNAHVVAGVSGGVDSTVCAALVHKAIGDHLHPILVDHGLMRQGEAAYVVEAMSRLGVRVKLVDAQDRFLDRLSGVSDPERKRKIIGEEFIRIFEEEARHLDGVEYLLQGTIYPDVIESGSRTRKVIKSHHNVGGLPERMNLKLLEPVRELFKDEVRLAGKEMGLSDEFLGRHPFPGPGLAVRVLGEVTRDRIDVVRKAQAVLDEEIRRAGWYDRLWQCFCVLPNVRTVGMTGDQRTYGHVIAIRAVHSEDAMTAEWARLPCDVLERVSARITSEVSDVNRVVLDITSKPPSTIEWE
ncbi:MAG TPA: glutamine-hydrolyzing GMP synthase [Firmicutes bacterium]|jgi:GMP synthase (glutamine-hydrolysing)|nr:glutamine-hydrolyzing GMP synthase [Candidatus Fermentithermobacillaceae bacterium]